MQKLIIQGGIPLAGEVCISGAKNAALPILCASLLTADTLKIENVPHLNDVTTMLALLRQMGMDITPDGKQGIELTAAHLSHLVAPYEMVKTMRAAILVLGPMLDVKLMLMYSTVFKPRAIVAISGTVALLVFVYGVTGYGWMPWLLRNGGQ